jgi:arylsulfatase A-like enzyme
MRVLVEEMPMFLVRVILCAVAGIFLLSGCEGNKTVVKPNLIVISIDTLRADHLGCYGYDKPTSPLLDKLATQGVLFENASATSPWTLPSHGSLLTGFYPSQIGLSSAVGKLPLDAETLATLISPHNFSTAAIVNSIYISERYGLNRGFDYFRFVPESYTTTGVAPTIIQDSIAWLDDHSQQQFFLFLHFYDVHSDYHSLPQYEKEFAGAYKGIIDGTNRQLLEIRHGKLDLDTADIQHLINLYDASIRQLNDQLEVLFDYLNKGRLLEKTFLIITSDHGEEFLEHGKILHSQTHYQEAIHIPLIMLGPGMPRSKRVKGVVSLVDVLPTALSLLEISQPSTLSGVDLAPLWKGEHYQLSARTIFSEADKLNEQNDIKRIARRGSYKLHHNILTEESELYDLAHDPKEHSNIASEQSSMVNLLFSELKRFMQTRYRGENAANLTSEEIEKLKELGYL